MQIRIALDVKFRVAGVTWGRLQRGWTLNLPRIAQRILAFSERGVSLTIDAQP
jgi:hypothetical protein